MKPVEEKVVIFDEEDYLKTRQSTIELIRRLHQEGHYADACYLQDGLILHSRKVKYWKEHRYRFENPQPLPNGVKFDKIWFDEMIDLTDEQIKVLAKKGAHSE